MLVMENINMTHEFKHPKYYTELRKRNKSDQAISLRAHDGERERTPDSGLKQEGSSDKQQAGEAQASSYKDSSSK
jgi:hypothetical protein